MEDNLEISEVMTVYCGFKKDIVCKVVNSGQEGLERIRNENFDLIGLRNGIKHISTMKNHMTQRERLSSRTA